MKNFYFLTVMIFGFAILSYSQSLPLDKSYNKWLRCIVNIETRHGYSKALSYYSDQFSSQRISHSEFKSKLDSLTNIVSGYTGTAFLIEYKKRHYLITARHVLFDETGLDSNSISKKIILIENDTLLNNMKRTGYSTNVSSEGVFVMTHLSAGQYEYKPYLFSSTNDDVGIICLDSDSITKEFYKVLIKRGYQFLSINDIDTIFKAKTSDPVFTIGFPRNSIVGSKRNPAFMEHWESSTISVPVLSRGLYLGEFPKGSNTFDANLFTREGFSGSPVISKGRVIGIVSGGEVQEFFLTGDKTPFKYIIYNHSRFIKSSLILSHLKKLEGKLPMIK